MPEMPDFDPYLSLPVSPKPKITNEELRDLISEKVNRLAYLRDCKLSGNGQTGQEVDHMYGEISSLVWILTLLTGETWADIHQKIQKSALLGYNLKI